ncbi:MAG TPA: ABC transporter ATP-binding protein [Sediminispirochaeta sp.]|nr:ABC transporter ATP-binding protein [Sediminispirochaeta sp.]
MLKRFVAYYKPHLPLFLLDMFVATAMSVVTIFFPYLTRNLLRLHIPNQDVAKITWSLGLMTLIYLLTLVFNYTRIKWGHILGVRIETDMRRDIFRHIQKLSFTYFDNTKTGHIMSRISNDLNLIAEVAHHAPEDLLISLMVILGAYGFMFAFSPALALISLIPFPFMLIWGMIFGGKMRRGFRRVRKEIAEINSTVENSVQGIREVKAFANEWLEEEKFHESNTTFRHAKEDAYSIMAGFHSVVHFLRDFYYLVVVGGGVILILHGVVETYDLLSFVLYIGIILHPIDRLINFNEQLQQGSAAFERFVEIMDIQPDITDGPTARSVDLRGGSVEFSHLWFRYDSSPEWVLQNINLQVPFGRKVAIVGESGAGKSTVVSLIPRFYEAQKGEISISSHRVAELSQHSLREQIGLVQQNVFLFDATIRENIMYGDPEAGEELMVEAARRANIYDFIQSLPEGFETEVGERGVKLSGGQKQRIAIARVFLKDPPFLIFDEATSALDNESESLIQEAMFRLSENRTTIIIAHRLSTVRNVDKIYVMRQGRIVEEGSHQELMDREGYYHQLYTRRSL